MNYLLDTDTLSIWQHGSGREYATLLRHISAHAPADIGVSIVSFHEQTLGMHAYLNRARSGADLVRGYKRLERIRLWYTRLAIAQLEPNTEVVYNGLKAMKLRIGTMDLRIGAIAISMRLTVITRNTSDFARIPGLVIEDWTR